MDFTFPTSIKILYSDARHKTAQRKAPVKDVAKGLRQYRAGTQVVPLVGWDKFPDYISI